MVRDPDRLLALCAFTLIFTRRGAARIRAGGRAVSVRVRPVRNVPLVNDDTVRKADVTENELFRVAVREGGWTA